jgi:hypothetical protein
VFLGGMIYLPALVMSLAYTWAQDNVNTPVTFYFLSLRSVYLPVLMLLLSLLLEGTPGALQMGAGYVSAHCYLFIDTIWPSVGGGRYLRTPTVLRRWLPGRPAGAPPSFGPSSNGGPTGQTSSASLSGPASGISTRFQGRGRRLGS